MTRVPYFLIFGGNGWIGSKVYQMLVDMNIKVEKAQSRACNRKNVEEEIDRVEPTHIMSFIGRTHGIYDGEEITTIDYLEKPGKLVENIRDNLYSPVNLADICKSKGIHFTYMGTGCIFDYDNSHPCWTDIGFTEEDLPNFFGSSYSTVKGFTDRLMHDIYNKDVLNIRIRMPITDEFNSRNFISKILKYKKICSIPNSMTVLDELLPIMIDYALERRTGTINLTNPGVISHNEILEMYREIVDNDFTWENFTIDEQNQILSSKRSNNYLDTTTLETTKKVNSIHDSVRNILYKMRDRKNNC